MTPMTTRANTKAVTSKPQQTKGGVGVGINVKVPAALHRKLRVKALQNELTLSDAIEAAVAAWVR